MDFIELLKVVFLGIVEGITEWLPISSTGHLILVEEFVKLDVSKQFWEMFMVVIQLGAILAVVVLYWNKIWPFRNKKPQHVNVTKIEKTAGFICRFVKIDKMVMWFKILVSCLPAILIGLPFDNFIEKTFNNWFVVSVMLIVYGVLFLLVEDYNAKRTVKVNSIAPSLILFNEHDDAEYRQQALNKSLMKTAPGEKEVIDLVDYLLTSCFVTGRSFPLDGGRHLR